MTMQFFTSSLHHSFDANLAEIFSVEEAILIHHFQFWIEKNKKSNKNFHDGRYWTYDTLEDITAHFPYWSRDQVNRLLRKLVKRGIIIKGNYNNNRHVRTLWYAFKDEEKFIIHRDLAKSPNGFDEIAKCNSTDNIPIYKEKEIYKEKVAKRKREELIAFKENVFLSKIEEQELLKLMPKEELTELILRLEEYQYSHNTTYADHYMTLRGWYRNNKNKEKQNVALSPNDNCEYAKMIVKKLQKFKGSGRRDVSFSADRTYFEINFHGKQPFTLGYTVKDFKNQLDEALKLYNFDIES